MSRKDVGDNVVEIHHAKRTNSWLLIKKCLDATKVMLNNEYRVLNVYACTW